MSTYSMLLGIAVLMTFISLILWVVFGQVTVRKLRKNSETKHELGMELASGWDILNVAGALAMPHWLNRKLRSTPLSFLYANAEILAKHTNLFDRILATVFYILFSVSGLALIILVLLSNLGVFE